MKCQLCDKQALYGLMKPQRCRDHKHPDMKFLKFKRCLKCPNRARYGKGNKELYCLTHKESDTVNVYKHKCKLCDRKASFGLSRPAEYCSLHKLDGMYNVYSKKENYKSSNESKDSSFSKMSTYEELKKILDILGH